MKIKTNLISNGTYSSYFPSLNVCMICTFFILFNTTLLSQPFNNDKIIDTSTANLEFQYDATVDVDNDGNVYVVWYDYTPFENLIRLAKSTDHGENFSVSTVETNYYDYLVTKMLIDKDNTIWILVRYISEGLTLLKVLKSTNGGISFVHKEIGTANLNHYFNFTSDSLGNIYIFWHPFIPFELNLVKIVRGDLNDTIKTRIPTPGLHVSNFSLSICVDPNGKNIYTVFAGYIVGVTPSNNRIYFLQSNDSGLTFTPYVQIDPSVSDSVDQDFAKIFFWRNKICITWRDNREGLNNLYYIESNDQGNTFTPPLKINNNDDGLINHWNYIGGNQAMVGLIWSSQKSDNDVFFSYKTMQDSSFSNPIKVGDTFYNDSTSQYPQSITIDDEEYAYIIFLDNRHNPGFYSYKVFISRAKFIINSTSDDKIIPSQFMLYQNFPNPFNSSTKIKYYLPYRSDVTLKLFDILGREVLILEDDIKDPGVYTITLNSDKNNLTSGIYFYTIQCSYFKCAKKLVIIK